MEAPAWAKLRRIRKPSQAGTYGILFTCDKCGGHLFYRPSLTYLQRMHLTPQCLITCSKIGCFTEYVLPDDKSDCTTCLQRVECLLYPRLKEIKYER